jgi:hypothetical protein
MAEKLRAYSPAGKGTKATGVFRDSLVANVRETVADLVVHNVGSDTDVAALAAEMDAKLAAYEPETLRQDPTAREQTAKAAEDILSKMSAMFA